MLSVGGNILSAPDLQIYAFKPGRPMLIEILRKHLGNTKGNCSALCPCCYKGHGCPCKSPRGLKCLKKVYSCIVPPFSHSHRFCNDEGDCASFRPSAFVCGLEYSKEVYNYTNLPRVILYIDVFKDESQCPGFDLLTVYRVA